MTKNSNTILFLGKNNDSHTQKALQFLRSNFSKVDCYFGNFGEELPHDELALWNGDYILSYLSPWIIPEFVLKKAKIAAINFHPAPPAYPGIGCTNFALYDGITEYGVTCHYMIPEVDSGKIIAVKKFSIFETDSVSSVLMRTYDYQLALFYDIIGLIINNITLPNSDEIFSANKRTRKQLNELAIINLGMTKDEIKKRIRATNFGKWKPMVEIQGFKFEFIPLEDNYND